MQPVAGVSTFLSQPAPVSGRPPAPCPLLRLRLPSAVARANDAPGHRAAALAPGAALRRACAARRRRQTVRSGANVLGRLGARGGAPDERAGGGVRGARPQRRRHLRLLRPIGALPPPAPRRASFCRCRERKKQSPTKTVCADGELPCGHDVRRALGGADVPGADLRRGLRRQLHAGVLGSRPGLRHVHRALLHHHPRCGLLRNLQRIPAAA